MALYADASIGFALIVQVLHNVNDTQVAMMRFL